MGGLVALMLAGARPQAVQKLVVVDIEAKPPATQTDHLREVGERGHRLLSDFESMTNAARAFLPGADEELVSRFKTEADAVAQLQHPNVVQIHEFIEYNGRLSCLWSSSTAGVWRSTSPAG